MKIFDNCERGIALETNNGFKVGTWTIGLPQSLLEQSGAMAGDRIINADLGEPCREGYNFRPVDDYNTSPYGALVRLRVAIVVDGFATYRIVGPEAWAELVMWQLTTGENHTQAPHSHSHSHGHSHSQSQAQPPSEKRPQYTAVCALVEMHPGGAIRIENRYESQATAKELALYERRGRKLTSQEKLTVTTFSYDGDEITRQVLHYRELTPVLVAA